VREIFGPFAVAVVGLATDVLLGELGYNPTGWQALFLGRAFTVAMAFTLRRLSSSDANYLALIKHAASRIWMRFMSR
jgi:hypothetical protein